MPQLNPLRYDDSDGNQTDTEPFYCTACLADLRVYDTALITYLGVADVECKTQYIEIFCSEECKEEYDKDTTT